MIDATAFQAAKNYRATERRKRLYVNDPVLWAEEMLGVRLWSKQKEILYSIRDNHNTAVAAAHSVGKSFIASVAMAWWADVHPVQDVKIISTAPTFNQVTSILWDNLRKWHIESKRRHEEHKSRLETGQDLGEYAANDHALPGYITSGNVWKTELGFEIGFGRKPPDNLLDSAFQGIHAPFLLVIGDEAAGLPEELVDALGNNATGSANRVLLIANPTNPLSAMAKIWTDEKKRSIWTTMNISLLDSAVVQKEPGFENAEEDGMSGWGYINEKKLDWGEEDPRYISRVLGEWAFDSGNTVFAEIDLARASDTVVVPDPNSPIWHGWDIARMGKDSTIGYRCQEGEVWDTDEETGEPTEPTGRRGIQIRLIEEWRKVPLVSSDPANLGSAERIDIHAIGEGCSLVKVDAAGLGSGVIDGLTDIAYKENRHYGVLEIFGQAAPSDRRAYDNMRVEQFFELKRRAYAAELDLDPKDTRLFDELRGVVYEYTTKGARKIESKDDMKKKGKKSPDAADALWYAALDAGFGSQQLAGTMDGDVVRMDPWEMLQVARTGPGMPI